jgi:dTDP-4-dehydrorhamnose reductase
MYIIIGGDSVVGKALAEYWLKNKIPFQSSTRHKEFQSEKRPFIDLTKTRTFENLLPQENAVICAAITDMGLCEKNSEETRVINVSATIKLIKRLNSNKTHIVFLSTNQVFDGKKAYQNPYAPRNPISEYGKQKAQVEEFIENIPNACIIRLTKVIHPELELLKKWKHSIADRKEIYAFVDMTLSPINIDEVVKKIDTLVRHKATGVYQVSGVRDLTYYEFAQNFAINNGLSIEIVKKDYWKSKLELAPPMYTSLLNV